MQVKRIFPLILTACMGYSIAQTGFNRTAFYTALTGQDVAVITSELTQLDKTEGTEAFKGALLMKKAGFAPEAKEKLMLFKKGHKDLELAILKDSTNTEYRFLRLVIQENAPKIVSYNKDIKKDALYIGRNYKSLSPALQKTILTYSKTSKELKPEALKTNTHD